MKIFKKSLNQFNSRMEVTEGRVILISANLEDRFIEVVQSEQQVKNWGRGKISAHGPLGQYQLSDICISRQQSP